MTLEPGGLLMWLVVGLVAGFLASRFMGSGGYGLIGDIILGIVGAIVGGFLLSFFFPGTVVAGGGLLGSIIVAFIGAIVLIAILRVFSPRRGLMR